MAPSLARPLIFGSDGWGQYLISALLLHPRLEFLGFRIELDVLAEFEVRNRLRRPRRSAVIYPIFRNAEVFGHFRHVQEFLHRLHDVPPTIGPCSLGSAP